MSVYKVIDIIRMSPVSREQAATEAVERAAPASTISASHGLWNRT